MQNEYEYDNAVFLKNDESKYPSPFDYPPEPPDYRPQFDNMLDPSGHATIADHQSQPSAYPTQTNYPSGPCYPSQNVSSAQFSVANQNVFFDQLQARPQTSFIAAIILSCFVIWLCGCLFGLIAFTLAISGMNDRSQTNARHLFISSIVVSFLGFLVGGVCIFLIIYFVTIKNFTNNQCPQKYSAHTCKVYQGCLRFYSVEKCEQDFRPFEQ